MEAILDMCRECWWVFLLLYLSTKISRGVETNSKKKRESDTSDAENLMLNLVRSVDKNIGNKRVLDTVLNDAADGLGDTPYKRILVDGLVSRLEDDKIKAFTPIKGSHPLSQLADRAVQAETKREKVKRGVKKAAVIGLKVLRGGLL